MKPALFLLVLLSIALPFMLAACASTESEAQLAAQAKVTKEQAQNAALAHVKNGTVKEAELERENGKLVWSFEIATPGTRNISEVHVDAITGAFLLKEIETPEDEAEEAAEDERKGS
jgi:hypothetical protein